MLNGTLAAFRNLFNSSRTITANATLTAADIGKVVLVNTAGGAVTVTLPKQSGAAGVSPTIGAGAGFVLIRSGANTLTVVSSNADTYNVGQAFSIAVGVSNGFVIAVSQGAASGVGDWSVLYRIA